MISLMQEASKYGGFLHIPELRGERMSKGGRKPKYTSKEQIEDLIEVYFSECSKNQRPPTITGLALALGFTSRQALLNYQAKKEFFDTITRAKARVEQYAEERLFDKEGQKGAQFSLRYNFSGWKDEQDNIPDDVPVQIVIRPRGKSNGSS